MLSSLLMVVGLVAAVFAHYIATTPPLPPANETDQVNRSQLLERGQVRSIITMVAKFAFALPTLSEVTLIVLATFFYSGTGRAEDSDIPSVIFTLLCPNPRPRAIDQLQEFSSLYVIGIALMILGSIVRFWTYHVLGDLFTYEVTIRRNHTLITCAPYSIVRHPSYTALFTVAIGFSILLAAQYRRLDEACGSFEALFGGYAVLWPTFWILLQLFLSISIWRRCGMEDDLMRQKFGPAWEEYRRDVPHKLIPGIL